MKQPSIHLAETVTPRTAVLFGLALILLFAGFQIWLFSQVDRAMERAETRRVFVHQDMKTKWMYQCYRQTRR